jgi:hypothetical protein
LPATPLAMSTAVSLVLVSPSTTMVLNDCAMATFSARRKAAGDTAASVRM